MLNIVQFFDGISIVITGTTGFIGKVLLEKILYACPDVKNVYILLRKNGLTPRKENNNKTRFDDLLESKIFDRIRNERPDDLKKIIPIWSDLTLPGLGISETDREMIIKNASVVFHSAATTKFNEPLKVAVTINLLGTKFLLELFKEFEKKLAFVYLSTAFSNCQRDKIEERVYPPKVSPDFLIETCCNFNDEAMRCLLPAISEGRPNSYVFTKAMAEAYLEAHCKDLPVAIIRPSIVGHALIEPTQGWGDSNSLMSETLYVIVRGLIHNLPINGEAHLDIIPVDMVCNLSLAVAASLQQIHNRWKKNQLTVFNCVSDGRNLMTYNKLRELGLEYGDSRPSTLILCYPHMTYTKNPIKLKFGEYFHHYLPALCLDLGRFIKGKSPIYFKLYRKFFKLLPLQRYFMEKDFKFETENFRNLFLELSSEEKKTFNFDIGNMSWKEFVHNWIEGLRNLWFPGENINLREAKLKLKLLYWRYIFYNIVLAISITAPITIPLYNALV